MIKAIYFSENADVFSYALNIADLPPLLSDNLKILSLQATYKFTEMSVQN